MTNSASVTGTPPEGDPVTTTTPLDQASHLTLLKTAATAFQSLARPGDVITFHFTVTNDGNLTLNDVAVTDQLAGLSPLAYTWPGATGVLTPTQFATATATYRITQADIDAGSVENIAVADGTTPAGADTPSNEEDIVTPIPQAPAITLTEVADASGVGDPARPGDTIGYSFTLTNTGNTTLTAVTITDALPGLSAIAYTWPGADGVLTPGQFATATADYTVTAADIASGRVDNTAFDSGTPPAGDPVDSDPATVTTPLVAPTPTPTPTPVPPDTNTTGGPLAATGSSTPMVAGGAAALLLVLAGASLTVAARRRRSL